MTFRILNIPEEEVSNSQKYYYEYYYEKAVAPDESAHSFFSEGNYMNLGDYSYEKPELVRIAEKIYECKANKRAVEYQLDEEEHHYHNIIRKQSISFVAIFWLLFFAVLLTLFDFVCLAGIMKEMGAAMNNYAARMAVGCIGPAYIVISVIALMFWIHAVRNLHVYLDIRKATNEDTYKFHAEQETSFQRIEELKAQIAAIDCEIDELKKKQEEQENRLGEHTRLADSVQEPHPTNAKFTIRKESLGEIEITQIIECYEMEMEFYKNEIRSIEKEIKQIERKIIDIDEKFELVKKKIIVFLGMFILYIIIQNFFSGTVYKLLSVVGLAASTAGILYITKISQNTITEYLIEHDNRIVRDYVFRNNILSYGRQRNEKIEEIRKCDSEIEQIAHRKRIVEGYL